MAVYPKEGCNAHLDGLSLFYGHYKRYRSIVCSLAVALAVAGAQAAKTQCHKLGDWCACAADTPYWC
jgi:hypothetical protein